MKTSTDTDKAGMLADEMPEFYLSDYGHYDVLALHEWALKAQTALRSPSYEAGVRRDADTLPGRLRELGQTISPEYPVAGTNCIEAANLIESMALRVLALEQENADLRHDIVRHVVIATNAESRAEASAKDAGRIDFMQKAMLAADFGYGDPAETVLVFKWPDTPVGADLRKNIDAAKEQKRG